MFPPTLIQPLPLLIPSMLRIHRIPRITLIGQPLNIAPELELLALCIRSLDGLHEIIDTSCFGGDFGLARGDVGVAV